MLLNYLTRFSKIVLKSNLMLLCISFYLISCNTYSQESIATQLATQISSPIISISENDSSFNLALQSLSCDVKVVGNIARTTIKLVFFNRENRVLEGELNFPLGEGITVSRFAMDINGKLREGVVVEKTIDPETNKWHYTHRRIRSAYRSLKTNLPYLFTWYDYMDLNIPNTTNSLEGIFSNLKTKLQVHAGLKLHRKQKLINELLKN